MQFQLELVKALLTYIFIRAQYFPPSFAFSAPSSPPPLRLATDLFLLNSYCRFDKFQRNYPAVTNRHIGHIGLAYHCNVRYTIRTFFPSSATLPSFLCARLLSISVIACFVVYTGIWSDGNRCVTTKS